ncbi:hypothetical protein A2799_01865 [Candidatus Roizmanbacteria bacterium RIFCSPHIGHO2_01_FULL_39_24]|uniref:Uncharacterized protein n=1 Tax=Candidatus Roizmanbacteria bacterium RIFCSPHIGHO2_01_FULL_39_24 TaxID=1802032 RepID=A0A1F7GFQ0_9BACT|nr:MAG: hypothetical protein A2799_01865 [Candidatus Roizmanbacteria bacterium RIFCSPHIGHO2_01_FULL_39_24]OGK49601.1 MAG: hypothetical protein A3A56_03420 [Candidatus Roizmanbacteria bacterium RIFCSPLOWO2_01_FULL_40_32]
MTSRKPTSPKKSSTQDFIEIEAVFEDVLMMKDYSCCVIIEPGATNFGLLGAEEQSALIYSFASLLNSLSFPVQIEILSRRMDISSYLNYLDAKLVDQTDEIIKKRLVSYIAFIKNMIKKNTVLEKTFYFIIPFSKLELGISQSSKTKLEKDYVFTRAKTSLYPKRDHLLRLLKKAGLGGRILYEQEIVELFYNLYNPSSTGRKLASIKNYTDIILTS